MKNKNVLYLILGIMGALLFIVLIGVVVKDEFFDDNYRDLDNYNEKYYRDDEDDEIIKFDENNNKNDSNTNNNNDNANNQQDYISKEEALNVAFNDLKINRNDAYDIGIELDYKFNTTVYEIDFNYNRFEYEYYVDALTGKIIKSFRERD